LEGGIEKGLLVFVGLGLYSEEGISLRGLEEIRRADRVFLEGYTSVMPGLSITRLESITGKQIVVLSRRNVEEEAEKILVAPAQTKRVCLLVPGDPMTATTHVDVRLRAESRGIPTQIVHAASIETAVSGATGLQSYKFGRTITIPFLEGETFPESIYDYCTSNTRSGLHTLILLDVRTEEKRFMTIQNALLILSNLEKHKSRGVFLGERLMIGIARLGGPDSLVKADRLDRLIEFSFGEPPHCLIAPGKLHFMEVEALKIFAKASQEVFKNSR
jgi:diphthine synthase